jgi:cellulose biosynthesis protein BcsQ
MTSIAIAQHKGGVGKSTLAWALSSQLAKAQEVLAIDLDPQGTLTEALCEGEER